MASHKIRPAFRYHGGKFKLAKKIIEFFPKHDTYCEPFGGAGSVLNCKSPAKAECYNDLNDVVVSFFRVLQDEEKAARLVYLLERTPYSRAEFELAYKPCDDDVESARRMLIRSWMGFGSDGTDGKYRTGFRRTVSSVSKFPASEWATYPPALQRTIERFKGVVIESMDGRLLMDQLDHPDTLFYVDPPYHPETRSQGNRRRGQGYHVYAHEMSEDDHTALLAQLDRLAGMVVLSGYPHPLYDEMLQGWQRFSFKAWADGGRERTECVWLNDQVVQRLNEERSQQLLPMEGS